jgi:hypothetical protein
VVVSKLRIELEEDLRHFPRRPVHTIASRYHAPEKANFPFGSVLRCLSVLLSRISRVKSSRRDRVYGFSGDPRREKDHQRCDGTAKNREKGAPTRPRVDPRESLKRLSSSRPSRPSTRTIRQSSVFALLIDLKNMIDVASTGPHSTRAHPRLGSGPFVPRHRSKVQWAHTGNSGEKGGREKTRADLFARKGPGETDKSRVPKKASKRDR